eukprot:CAMPEP_0115090074 /NCGR_PEP_ID=MMETSP0227-20121206/25155_1 /TAXON_ID=89957 /ORGANISM="Polarella glacialis, Strain CCMP 1383" /LENGTH=100 /DNA_ID=CAMNT_0002481035 /DNA_START=48 /DNA_END=347 /DNA_ORIENTATION=+
MATALPWLTAVPGQDELPLGSALALATLSVGLYLKAFTVQAYILSFVAVLFAYVKLRKDTVQAAKLAAREEVVSAMAAATAVEEARAAAREEVEAALAVM